MPPGDKKKKITLQEQSADIESRVKNIGSPFYKTSGQYPYLSSRFVVNADIRDPFKRNIQPNASNAYTLSQEDKMRRDREARRSYNGPPKYLKSAEKAAKAASKISTNLSKAIYGATKSLAAGDANTADDMVFNAVNAAKQSFKKDVYKNVGRGVISDSAYRNIDKMQMNYFHPRIQAQAKNMTTGVQMPNIKITAPDAKEINASLRSLTSRKKK